MSSPNHQNIIGDCHLIKTIIQENFPMEQEKFPKEIFVPNLPVGQIREFLLLCNKITEHGLF